MHRQSAPAKLPPGPAIPYDWQSTSVSLSWQLLSTHAEDEGKLDQHSTVRSRTQQGPTCPPLWVGQQQSCARRAVLLWLAGFQPWAVGCGLQGFCHTLRHALPPTDHGSLALLNFCRWLGRPPPLPFSSTQSLFPFHVPYFNTPDTNCTIQSAHV